MGREGRNLGRMRWAAAVALSAVMSLAATCGQGGGAVDPRPDVGPETPDAGGVEEDPVDVTTDCPRGQVEVAPERCCWPEQRWDEGTEACTGEPQCPQGWLADGASGCVAVEDTPEALLAACDEGLSTACERFNVILEAQCEEDDLDACGVLAARLLQGLGASPDPALALDLYEKTCGPERVEDCLIAGDVAREGEPERAAVFFERACEAGQGIGCLQWMELLVVSCRQGEGCAFEQLQGLIGKVEADAPVAAVRARAELCERWVTEGRALEDANPCRALTDFAKADALAGVEGAPPVDELLEVACTGVHAPPTGYPGVADPRACHLLAERLEVVNTDRALRLSANYHRKACTGLVPGACMALGRLYQDGRGVMRDDGRAVHYYQLSCDRGQWRGCSRLAWMMARGRGILRDPTGAASLFERACAAEEPRACYQLGLMLGGGQGIDARPARAREMLDKACRLGWRPACEPNAAQGDPQADPG